MKTNIQVEGLKLEERWAGPNKTGQLRWEVVHYRGPACLQGSLARQREEKETSSGRNGQLELCCADQLGVLRSLSEAAVQQGKIHRSRRWVFL